jgi:hypothetical protein
VRAPLGSETVGRQHRIHPIDILALAVQKNQVAEQEDLQQQHSRAIRSRAP